jgi:hypothetical protein
MRAICDDNHTAARPSERIFITGFVMDEEIAISIVIPSVPCATSIEHFGANEE